MEARVRRILSVCVALVVVVAVAMPASGQVSTTVFADDGTPLATDVYRPFGSGAHPVILIRTPYGRDGWVEPCLAFAILGYACVAQDTRGRGDSGGEDTVFRDDADDGRATIEWVAEQSWCDGNIGMFGGSAFAITQYLPAPGGRLGAALDLAGGRDAGSLPPRLSPGWCDPRGAGRQLAQRPGLGVLL